MTNHNLFQEIEEDLQRQKMEALWKKHGKLILGTAFAIVLATAAGTSWRTYQTNKQQTATAGLVQLGYDVASDKAKQIESYESFARAHPGTNQALLARLEAAALALSGGETEKGLALYDAIAKDDAVETPFRQLADLMVVQTQLDTGDPKVLQDRLAPLLEESPWRVSAKEYTALLALRAGDKAKAKQFYSELSQEIDAPSSLLRRANDMLRWLNEEG
ncbi:MAG: tetratricopeptide repeat protein [Alphaproteobacteria bacterium]|nr:tetratricopeptide repeat protein [Alphaproteobacteria bacterium]